MEDEKTQLEEQIPQTIGRYQIQGCIGFGAMGAVYKAFDPLIKRTLAIKTIRLDIPRQSPQYRSFLERFYHEARISGTLSHPNIVTLFDIGEESGLPYLAMEFVAGETIASIIEKGTPFAPERVIGLISQVASAIDYAHSKGVIHRDIKPSNLILSEGDRVKVTDFGIAKLIDADMTQSGTLLGTPSYMSPEQAMGEKLDGRSDLFSLGVCAFEMLSGEQPFPGSNVTAILYKLVHVDPIEPATLEMHGIIPDKWQQVFHKVLAKKPDDRYQCGAEFVQEIEYCLGDWFGGAMGDQTIERTAVQRVPPPGVIDAPPAAAMSKPEPAASQPPEAQAAEDEEAAPTVLMTAAAAPVASAPPPAPAHEEEEVTVAMVPGVDMQARRVPPAEGVSDHTAPVPVLTAPFERVNVDAPPPAEKPQEEEEEVATVLLKAAPKEAGPVIEPEADGATVVMVAESESEPEAEGATVVMAAENMPEGATVNIDQGATVLQPVVAAPAAATPAKAQKEPPAAAPSAPVAPPAPRSSARPTPPPAKTPTAMRPAVKPAASAPAAPRRGVSLGLLAGVAFLLFILAAGTGLFAIWKWRQMRGGESPSPEPTATTAPTPEPTPVATPEPVSEGRLHIETDPPGAAIAVNGAARGQAPLDLTLPLGLYDISAAAKGYETKLARAELTANQPQASISMTLSRSGATVATGTIDLNSIPGGAEVWIDGARVGLTPLRGFKASAGTRRYEVKKDGYHSVTGAVQVTAGAKAARIDVALKPIVTATPTPAPDVVDVNKVYAESDVSVAPKKVRSESVDGNKIPSLKKGERISVIISYTVTETGTVTDITIEESGGKRLDDAVSESIRKSTYQPALKNGVKVKVRLLNRKFTYVGG